MKPTRRERIVLFILNILALTLVAVTGCKLLEKKSDRVWYNGQWYDRAEYERIRK